MLKHKELLDPFSCLNKAGDDEMVFVLLGRDPAAPVAIRAWVNERVRIGKNTRGDPQLAEAIECAYTMERDRKNSLKAKQDAAIDKAKAAGLSDEDIAALTLTPAT